MQVTVESTGTLERKLRVELPAESIEQEVDSRLKSVGRTAKIKGFRPGKVPARVVRRQYGKQIRQEVLSEMMQKSYSDAVAQEKLNPAGSPSIEPEDAADEGNFSYVATLEVMPEVELKALDKIKVEKTTVEIGAKDIDEMILKLRKQKAEWQEVERKSADGDRVVCDFEGSLDGELFDGGQGKDVPVILGQGQMLPDFEKGLKNVKAGDEKSIKVKFPKDYHAEDLAGKKADFALTVHRVEEEVLPAEDDALAEMFNVTEGGLEKFREDVIENMRRESDQKSEADLREQVMQGLLDSNPLEIPNVLKHQEMHAMQHEAMQRMGIEDHAQAPPLDNFAEGAEKRVRLGLLMRQLISDQELSVSEEHVRAHVEKLCASYENPDEMVDMYMGNPQVVQQVEPVVLEQLAIDWLLENGKVKEKTSSFTDYMNS